MHIASEFGKIVHQKDCIYVKRIKHRIRFGSLPDAFNAGFRMCSCCSLVRLRYERGRSLFDCTAKNFNLRLYFKEGLLHIHDGLCDWIIICSFAPKTFLLFHENRINKYSRSNIPGYAHIRGYHKQKFNSPNINEILLYIEGHKKRYKTRSENFSLGEKKRILMESIIPKNPAHNTPNNKRYSKRKRARKKYNTFAAFCVLDMIDSLFPMESNQTNR